VPHNAAIPDIWKNKRHEAQGRSPVLCSTRWLNLAGRVAAQKDAGGWQCSYSPPPVWTPESNVNLVVVPPISISWMENLPLFSL